MQTKFPAALLADPTNAESERVIRKCVHCGFCTATCPTYVLRSDELDSPRGRIYLIKDMLENQRTPSAETVKHVDRCLSCLACMTTCPSGVNYMHLVDHARAYIETNYKRPFVERMLRATLAKVLPHPARFRAALGFARLGRPLAEMFGRVNALKPVAAMLRMAPRETAPWASEHSEEIAAPKGRVILLQGCVEPVLRPQIREATVRLLNRLGFEVTFAREEGCCGALAHHLGREEESLSAARRNVDAWAGIDGVDAILVTASGCGTMLKEYGFLLRDDPGHADKAARLSALVCDVSEFLARQTLPAANGRGLNIAYQSACSLQHGQKVTDTPVRVLEAAGYQVSTPAESHLCCGSAGTYNILQPEIAAELGDRKATNLSQLNADVIATGNIGCANHLAARVKAPIVHLVQLVDWATGGPTPIELEGLDPGTMIKADGNGARHAGTG